MICTSIILSRCRDLNPGPLPYQGSALPLSYIGNRAENGTQTRDPQLGRLMLYQLSYFRNSCQRLHSSQCGQRWIRTTEVERQQIYSLPHLATLVFAHISSKHNILPCTRLMSLGNGCKVRHYFFRTKLFHVFFSKNIFFLT